MELESLRCFHLMAPHSPSSCKKPLCVGPLFQGRSRKDFIFSLAHHRPSPAFGSRGNLKTSRFSLSCRATSNGFSGDEISKHFEELKQRFDAMDKDGSRTVDTYNGSRISNRKNNVKTYASMSLLPSKLECLEPNLLGIRPEPPEWPEREEIVRLSIQQKANSCGIPLSLRMIKRKQKWQEGIADAGDFAYCSAKVAFSSMVLIIRELQNYALSIRESLYSEDLHGVMSNVQMEMNASFVWLFQQVFSRTPTLMVYVMLLLANFTAHSMVGDVDIAACASSRMTLSSSLEEVDHEQSEDGEFNITNTNGGGWKSGQISRGRQGKGRQFGRLLPSEHFQNDVPFPGMQDMQEDEEVLWNSLVEEAALVQAQSMYDVLDHETMQQFISPLSVELESDDYEEYHKTDLVYQMSLAEDPANPLLLSNYAQFLRLVTRDYDRAEECFKRAIMVDPPDAEALSHYADFLWIVRKDLWGAEENYQQAMAADPNNHYFASRYANFLWNTGGEDTCFPLNDSNDNQIL
ncbi:hypothetical protein Tsubulata_036434 [Turnera subulata]|uniref:Uncharacterized protein n=1 Tax=Turnera subulata TaxID=218843 RepID=A0A9Q0FGC7_9ROSI|nr:hypothetical protein Tsubulata_036434 [Turnera subulata]